MGRVLSVRLAQLLFLLCLSGVLVSPSFALTISGVSASTNPGDSGYQYSSFWGDYESDSAAGISNTGGTTADAVGATMTAGTRYAQFAWADNTSGSTTHSLTSDYRVTMDIIVDDPGTVYNLQIDTTRLGALTLVDDSSWYGCCFSSATIGDVSGYVGGVLENDLGMTSLTSNESPTNQVINQASSVTLLGLSGNYSLVLDFSWTAEVFSNNDEAAVRLGLVSSTSGVSADDYPGAGGRTAAADGHFVDVTATVTEVVPEPSTVLLLGLGLAGLAVRKRA